MKYIVGIDPGGRNQKNDYTGLVIIKVGKDKYHNDLAQVIHANQYHLGPKAIMQIVKQQTQDLPYIVFCETNNYGTKFNFELNKYHKVYGVVTVAKSNKQSPYICCKPDMIAWLQDHIGKDLHITKQHTDLITQLEDMTNIITATGHLSQKARCGRHDDIVSALLIASNGVRQYWMENDNS